jgi:homoserine O-acetyltransferase
MTISEERLRDEEHAAGARDGATRWRSLAEGETAIIDIGPLTRAVRCSTTSASPSNAGANSPRPRQRRRRAARTDRRLASSARAPAPDRGLVGRHRRPGAPIDTTKWCAIATNVLGGCRGSTGPSSLARDGKPWGSRFPAMTIRDQVAADVAALAALGIDQVAAVIGGSMGGARALEWAVGHHDSVRSALVLAVGARATADQIGPVHPDRGHQGRPELAGRRLLRHRSTPDAGLKIARQFAHLTYRGELDLDERFTNDAQGDENPLDGGRYAVQSYLQHQGDKLLTRFDAGSYVALSDSCPATMWPRPRRRGRGAARMPGAGGGRRHHLRSALPAASAA